MTTNTDTPRGLIPWKKRATYKVSKSKRARKKQYDQQMNMIYVFIGTTIVFGFVFIFLNWQNAGAAKAVSCAEYPHYCVPLAGGAAGFADLEAATVRQLDEDSHGAPGVMRYVDDQNVPTIGDPNAPVHFRTISNYACSHCNAYHTGDLEQFIQDYVLTGQATLGFVLNTTSAAAGPLAETAAQAGLCAGEQGAFWEMSDELYRLARTSGAGAFTTNDIGASADNMDLDKNALVDCINSGRYYSVIDEHFAFMNDYGVTATPTLLVMFDGDPDWTKLDAEQRSYGNMATMTEQANAILGN
jgi:protein-disulfide isomerase